MRLIILFILLFSINIYAQDNRYRSNNLINNTFGEGAKGDEKCRNYDPQGIRIYYQTDSRNDKRCVDYQTTQKFDQCVRDPNWGQAFWVGSGSSSRLICARSLGFNEYDEEIFQFEGQQANCPAGMKMGQAGNCEKTEQVGTRGGSGTADGNQQQQQAGRIKCSEGVYADSVSQCPNNRDNQQADNSKIYECNVSGIKIPVNKPMSNEAGTQMAQQECENIKRAYEVATTTVGKETALTLDVSKLSEPIKNCQGHRDNAQICCGDPYKCIGGDPDENDSGAMSVIGGILQGGNKLIAGGTASITNACNTLKNLGRTASAIQAGMSQKCRQYANRCQENCKEYQKPLNEMNDYFSNQNVCNLKNLVSDQQLSMLLNESAQVYKTNCQYKQRVSRLKEEVTSILVSCNTSEQDANKILQDSIGTQSIAEFANKCEDISSNQNQFAQDPSAPFNGDCTNPAHSSNPICVQCRLDPSAQQCAGINLGGSPTQANNSNSGLIEEESDNDDLMGFNSLGTSNASDANPGLGDPQAIAPNGNQGLASSGAGGGGGGGGLGQDNIQALGTDPASQGGAAGGGYDTNILGNASGGGGYSVSSMGYGSGGGYNPRITTDVYENTPPTGIMKDGFDLKEYLPGGKAYKKKSRLPAGYIQLPDGEVIGPKHGNIFQMMHERYAYYESLGKFWPANYSKEKIECIKKSGILNNPPYSNQWTGDNLHKPTPIPNPPQCRHFADHDPNKPDPTQIYLKAETKKEMTSRTPQSLVASYKNKSLHEIYHTLTKRKDSLTKAQYSALYKLYKDKYSEYNKTKK